MPLLAARPRLLRALRALRASLAAAAVGVAGAGCSDSTGPSSVAGAYTLVSYQGSAIPVTLGSGGFRSELLGGTLNLRTDQTFDVAVDARDTDLTTGVVDAYTEAYSGRYTVRGRIVTFTNTTDTDDDGVGDFDNATATVSGTTVTLGDFVFRR